LEYHWDLKDSSATPGGALTCDNECFYYVVKTTDSFEARLQVVEKNGVESKVASREIAVEMVAPTLNVKSKINAIGNANVVSRFDLAASFFSGRTVEQWALNWGDGTETVLDERSSAATFARCYQANCDAKSYVATLKLTASDGEVYDFTFGETFVPACERVKEVSTLIVTVHSDVVDSTDGKISLREAILYAEADATLSNAITFAPSLKGKTITLSETELAITKSITIDASALYNASTGTPGITVDAYTLSRVFYINGGSEEKPVELIGLTITGGRTEENGGGICLASGVANFQKCAIVANTATYGGGLYVGSGGGVALDCVISCNDANYGGAAYIACGFEYSLEFINCLAVENEATNCGGAFYLDAFEGEASSTFFYRFVPRDV